MRPRPISLLLATLAALTGCVATPQPNPPGLDPTRIAVSGGGRDTGADLVGAPGAILPADAVLWVTPLDATSDPIVVSTAADGSFTVGPVSGRHRLQPRLGEARGAILDVEVDVDLVVIEPSLSCLDIALEEPAGSVAVGDAADVEVVVRNDCEDAVTIDATMRRTSDFAITFAPTRIEAASEEVVRVRFAPEVDGDHEEILLVDVDGPGAERRWVTLYGVGTR